MQIQVTQFIRPNGRQEKVTTEISDSVKEKYDLMIALALRFTAEVLTTGQVSVCIEHPDLGDFDMEIVSNGPKVQAAYEKMLTRFDESKYHAWKGTFL